MEFWGFSPRIFLLNIFWFPSFWIDYYRFRKLSKGNMYFRFGKIRPVLTDKRNKSGKMATHYFFQDLLVARRIRINNPAKHVDIGSRIDGFVAHVASFMEIEVFDIRPINQNVVGINFKQTDFMKIDPELNDYTDSISSLHALEHFGLGRYGDVLDISGHIKGLDSVYYILKKGGKFYFSSPIGPQRIEFNAHRVFSISYLIELFSGRFNIDYFSFIDDAGTLHENADLTPDNIMTSFGCKYGCGIFEMTKI